jgi:iron complex transport system ATP-binding protein
MKLAVRDAEIGFDRDKPLQRSINFSVSDGEICCVLGPNGCGKTTLFKAILGIIPLSAGSVTIDGDNILKWPSSRLASTMAYVAQAHRPPFPYLVKDVVMLGRLGAAGATGQPSREDYHIVENVMQDMGIYHLRERPYTDVSGGELEMVMIARALSQQPRLLVLDEPTAALDYGNAIRVVGKIRELAARGYAVLMTTHSPDHAFMCNSNVALMQRVEGLKFGRAVDIITEKNMQRAYGVEVRVVEFVNTNGEIMRMCAPQFSEPEG